MDTMDTINSTNITSQSNKILFLPNQVVATKKVLGLLSAKELSELLSRHSKGDWGNMSEEDKKMNDLALLSGEGRLFSSYETSKGKIWIITEADRSVTTVLLHGEH